MGHVSSPLRRLLALATLLSFLIGSSGWERHGCVLPASTHGGHFGMVAAPSVGGQALSARCASGADASDAACAGRDHGATPSRCDRDGMPQNASAPGGCASPGHCASWSPLVPSAPYVATLAAVSTPRALHDASVPLGPDAEPDFPPPRA